jgi:hypothetical protein
VDVALALLAGSGPANVLLGTLFAMIPYVAPAVALPATRIAWARRLAEQPWAEMEGLALLATAVTILTTPVLLSGIVVGIGLVFWATRRTIGRPGYIDLKPIPYWTFSAGFPALSWIILISTPWLAPESIVLNGTPTTAYVASSDSTWTYLLVESRRVVSIVRTDAIGGREPCRLRPSVLTITLPDLSRPLGLPVCPQ